MRNCAGALEMLDSAGQFDLIFADAQGGKWDGLDRAIAALRPHGLLIVDDMNHPRHPACLSQLAITSCSTP